MQQQAVQPDVDTYLRAGKAAAAQGKIDQALTILTAATAKFPSESRAWFAVAGLHAKLGHHDMAALCFHRASSSASSQAVAEVAHDNALLECARVLPRDWLPAITAAASWAPWSQALSLFAHDLTQGLGGTAVVLGGLGVQAVQLAAYCAQQELQQASWHVVSCHGDQLTGTLGHLLAVSNGVDEHVSLVPDLATWVMEWQEEHAEQEEHEQQQEEQQQGQQQVAEQEVQQQQVSQQDVSQQQVSEQGQQQGGKQEVQQQGMRSQPSTSRMMVAQPHISLVLLPEVCAAQLSLTKAVKQIRQVASLVSSSARVCPCRIRVRGVLVESEELLDMNRVCLDWMMQDTGLEYAPCNELLWRRARSLQVDKLKYRTLSAPFDLVDVDLQSFLTQWQPGSDHSPRIHPTRFVQLHCTAPGSVTCVVTWTEVEVAPGIWIRHAPQQASADSCSMATHPPVLQPHVWQRVHFIAEQLQVSAGQTLQLDVRLQGDELHIELDADVPPAAAAAAGVPQGVDHAAAEVKQELGSDAAGTQQPHGCEVIPQAADNPGMVRVDVTDSSLPAGEPLEEDENHSNDSESEEEDAGAASLILPYHMCMLNDRARTTQYRDGIKGAVRAMLHRRAGQLPPLVLDVGAGTGLLSLLAAQAGAPAVIGVEREAPLAVTASTLAHANSLQQHVHCLNMQCNALTVAAEPKHTRPKNAASISNLTNGGPDADAKQRSCEGRSEDTQQRCNEATAQHGTKESRDDGHSPAAAGVGAYVIRDTQTGQVQLTQAPALVVHEVFGSDPLSEQILTTMRYVKARLATPSTRFMPAGFRVITALAWTGALKQALCTARHLPSQQTPQSTGTAGTGQAQLTPESADTAGGEQTQPLENMQQGQAASTKDSSEVKLPDLNVLQPWVSQRVECDLAAVTDMVLLTHPKPVLHWDLNAPEPPALQGETTVLLTACHPTPISHFISHQAVLDSADSALHGQAHPQCDHQGAYSEEPAEKDIGLSEGRVPLQARLDSECSNKPNCAVYWFEADCGEGGWLSTGPGHTYYGHWSQCIDFSAVASLLEKTAEYVVKASYMVDRVKIRVAGHTA